MKKIYRTFGIVAVWILLASNVSANTTNLSSDPSYAEGLFLFWCEGYVRSFEEGKHYKPDTGPCVYSIPSTITGSPIIELYKGDVGNSSLLIGGSISGATLVETSNVSFGSFSNNDSVFAVVYDEALNQGSDAFRNYLQSGSDIPVGAIENGNYYIREWVYGSKPTSEFDPLVVIPDTLATWDTDGGFITDPLFKTYQNLVDTFTANGYTEGENLFILPYNWENSTADVATEIKDEIASIKNDCNCSYVDVLAHGASGLAATAYIQSGDYNNDIDQIVYVGTPFNGIPGAYPAWEAGQIQFDEPVRNGLAQTLLNHKAVVGGLASTFEYVQAHVPSFLEILPASDYLNGKSYPTDYPQNVFLESLQANFLNVGSIFTHSGGRQVEIHQFNSDSSITSTPVSFSIAPSSEPPLWPHGQITATQFTTGDDVVPFAESSEYFLSSDVYTSNVGHHELMTEMQSDIFETLNNIEPGTVIENNYATSCVLFLTVSQGTDLQVTDPNNLKLGTDFDGGDDFAEISRSVYSGGAADAEYLGIANPAQGTYQVRTQGNVNGSFTLTASDVCDDGTHSTTTTATIGPGQVLGYSVTVDEDNTLSIESLDNGAPTVTINTPAQGSTHFSNASVLASVTVNDPEGSPIALVEYFLNGTSFNHLVPMPLSIQPLGTAQAVVAATDVFGNTGYATSTFTIAAPPQASTTVPLVADTYLRGIASDTNEGASPILRIQGLGDNRIVVKADTGAMASALAGGDLVSAKLEFKVEGSLPNWGSNGREVVINRLLMGWIEGNGKNAEIPLLQRVRGSGSGATWDCATDTNIKNTKKDCSAADDWNMRLLQVLQNLSLPWVAQSTDGVYIQRGQQGYIAFDVTADVQAFLNGTQNYGWIVRKSLQNRPGYITFHSREAGANGPRLILTYTP